MECLSFADLIGRGIAMLQGFTAQKTADGEITDAELDQLQGELEAIISGIEYERECRETARQAAAGHAADKNRAERVNWQDLDLSDVKPGQDQRGA